MSQEIEIEYKNLLTKEEYNRILAALPFPVKGKTQINYYFETKDLSLRTHHSALRIREKDGAYRLTLKEPHQLGLLETHDSLTEQEADQWIQGNPIEKAHTTKQLRQMGLSPKDFICYGSLTTERREYTMDGLIYVLDYSTYNGQSDYELEIEAPNTEAGLEAFHQLLNTYHIIKRTTPNKIQRFFSTLT